MVILLVILRYIGALVGAVQYLTFTRPGISDAVQQVCLYTHDPREPHLIALKRILRYVRGTTDHGLQLHVSSTSQLTSYTDADWTGCPVARRSTPGYCVFLGDNLLSWSAQRQVTVSRFSAEVEYKGVANVVAETACMLISLPKAFQTLYFSSFASVCTPEYLPLQLRRRINIILLAHWVLYLIKRLAHAFSLV
nr:ribonuclease H-like domain-containing protein [Tanacetum cinerariifolium]